MRLEVTCRRDRQQGEGLSDAGVTVSGASPSGDQQAFEFYTVDHQQQQQSNGTGCSLPALKQLQVRRSFWGHGRGACPRGAALPSSSPLHLWCARHCSCLGGRSAGG